VDAGVHVFKGVRYAASTAGTNRFRPPQPPERWGGITDAISNAASAPQRAVPENTDPFYSWYAAIEPIGEDCLFLNVFSPGLSDARRPVMVWIHGGGWREFSGTAPGFDGRGLARAGDVVVVTLNHRLSVFGFLRLERSDERFADAGNAGLLDIVAALAWIKQHATAFGGDPNNVTLFGESGGASKIAALLSMPAAKGLFHKAILQSSGGGMRLAEEQEAERLSASLATALGRSQLDGEALQAVAMQTLLDASWAAAGAFRGMIDGRSCISGPFHETAPAISANVPVMIGCTSTETTYHLRWDPKYPFLEHSAARERLARFLKVGRDQAETIMKAYGEAYPDYKAGEILMMVSSDFIFRRTANGIAALQAASATAPVFAYMFARETPVEGGHMRCPHTSEVPFIFGTTEAATAQAGWGSDIEPLTQCMMASWTAFARHGDPNNATLPRWEPFTNDKRHVMVLDAASWLAIDPGHEARRALEDLPLYDYSYSLKQLMKDQIG
jgi:para-nitrobenzyl esterase